MIIISVISLIISLFLQGLMSNFLGYTISNLSIFSTIYILVNIVVLQQYFENDKKSLILIIIFGMLFDIVYSNTFILSTCIFITLFYLNKLLSFFFPYNILTINVFSLLSVFIYHLITFIFLKILIFDSYGIINLIKILGCNIIMTLIYTTILYYIIGHIYKKFNLKIVRDKY
jgi:hypothetical protein